MVKMHSIQEAATSFFERNTYLEEKQKNRTNNTCDRTKNNAHQTKMEHHQTKINDDQTKKSLNQTKMLFTELECAPVKDTKKETG